MHANYIIHRVRLHSCTSTIVLSTILVFYNIVSIQHASGQFCEKTKWNSNWNHPCPLLAREAYTIENRTSRGTVKFSKICCRNRAALDYNKAVAKSCQTTRCVLPSEPFNAFRFPCGTLSKVIVDGKYVTANEESIRDECVNENTRERGVTAVCCPPDTLNSLLVSAYGAERNEFPHHARVQSGEEICGGTLYNRNYVITAAHCVTGEDGTVQDPNNTYVVLGSNIAKIDSVTNIFPIRKITVHEGFSLKRGSQEFHRVPVPPKRLFNDIAILQLARSVNFATEPHIRALPLAPPNFQPWQHADQAVVVGWGTTDNGLTTEHLQKANLLIRHDNQCFKPLLGGGPYPNMQQFSGQLMCLGGVLNGEFSPVAGKGDSGGPAICRGAHGYAVHCGITSFAGDGDACSKNLNEHSCKPSGYVDVSYFRDWIRAHAGEQQNNELFWKKLYGDPVPRGQHEHQVQITSNGRSCGGTLVSRDTVLTAGHCVLMDNGTPRENVTVMTTYGSTFKPRANGGITGTRTFARNNLLEQLNYRRSGVKSYLTPPYNDDIAVIKLQSSVPISNEKLPKLPENRNVPSKGVNALELSIPFSNKRQKWLNQRIFRILDSKECQKRMDRFKAFGVEARFDMRNVFCGVEEYSGGSMCDRETGGGLIQIAYSNQQNWGKQILTGIQAFRLCDLSMPSLFVNVANYLEMILKIINLR